MSIAPHLSPTLWDAVYADTEFDRRPIPDAYAADDKAAILELAARMADEPEAVLPRFVELAMDIGAGVSAGLSFFEGGPGAGVFWWRHLHGTLAVFEEATTPRDFSPCGVTLDRRLQRHPAGGVVDPALCWGVGTLGHPLGRLQYTRSLPWRSCPFADRRGCLPRRCRRGKQGAKLALPIVSERLL